MNDEILDLPEVMDRVQDDKELLLELFDIYTTDFNEKRKLLDQAIQNNDCEQVVSLAHSLKGASGNISAKLLRATFYKYESMGKSGNISEAKGGLAVLDQQFADLLKRMDEVREQFKKG
jgi:two-component system, sensor histidine kinase and response regulator